MDAHRTDGGAPAVAALTSANEAVFAPPPRLVRRLVLNEGATRVMRASEEHKSDELWQGDAYDDAQPEGAPVPVYFRIGEPRVLVAELVCGCMAHRLGLPAPEVFVLSIPEGALHGSSRVPKGQGAVCVATHDLGGETFGQFLDANADAAVKLLRDWPDLGRVIAFDEWTANIDRNLDNIIYSLATLHIIDHAEAFGGACQEVLPLAQLASLQLPNKLIGLLGALRAKSCHAILAELHTWLGETAACLDVHEVITHAQTRQWQEPEKDGELVDFLRQRLPITHALLCQQLGHPQLALKA
ncbi:HipA family kinase [Melaminivora sp.]|uniref:HipA family kinase n=1 Tax=Melaminivora sp. TaxID=1933032 RepID=UPI0028AC83FB|nr:HipA family kinase [Melaminivora sp.]